MIRILGTIFAGLLGLAFGSFMNVCLSRWPEGESIVKPRSHCRSCGHELAWWENVPLVSWIALRGRCRTCGTRIGWRYPLVEASVGIVWSLWIWRSIPMDWAPNLPGSLVVSTLVYGIAQMALCWFLIALATLDAENLWLPDFITIPAILSGILFSPFFEVLNYHFDTVPRPWHKFLWTILATVIAGSIVLVIRGAYWLVRRKEGIGLGDAKLMAMLGAWLGLQGALLAFVFGVVLGALAALAMLIAPKKRSPGPWAMSRLPLGTFLCIGGIVSSLWGPRIISTYLRWAGF